MVGNLNPGAAVSMASTVYHSGHDFPSDFS